MQSVQLFICTSSFTCLILSYIFACFVNAWQCIPYLTFMIESVEYIDANGRNSYARWFNRLNRQASARVAKALARMKDGNFSNTRGVGAGVIECRIDFGPGYRIYFGREGDVLIILLGGGTKQRQQWDIETARQLWREYKRRKRQET